MIVASDLPGLASRFGLRDALSPGLDQSAPSFRGLPVCKGSVSFAHRSRGLQADANFGTPHDLFSLPAKLSVCTRAARLESERRWL